MHCSWWVLDCGEARAFSFDEPQPLTGREEGLFYHVADLSCAGSKMSHPVRLCDRVGIIRLDCYWLLMVAVVPSNLVMWMVNGSA